MKILLMIYYKTTRKESKRVWVSNFTSPQMDLIQQNMPLAWNQIECSLTHEESMFNGTLDHENSCWTMAWSP